MSIAGGADQADLEAEYALDGVTLSHSTACGYVVAAQRTWTPAARAPVLHPPRLANRSIAEVMRYPSELGRIPLEI